MGETFKNENKEQEILGTKEQGKRRATKRPWNIGVPIANSLLRIDYCELSVERSDCEQTFFAKLGALSGLAVRKVFDFEIHISLVIVTTPKVLKASI
jgi:hypothetical protein